MATFVLRLTPQDIQNISVDSAEPPQNVVDPGGVGRDPRPDPGARPGDDAGWSSSTWTA